MVQAQQAAAGDAPAAGNCPELWCLPECLRACACCPARSLEGQSRGCREVPTDMPRANLLCLQAIAQAEAQKAAMEMRAAAVREEQEDLQKELETLQLTVEAAKADVGNAQRDLRSLRDKVSWVLGC